MRRQCCKCGRGQRRIPLQAPHPGLRARLVGQRKNLLRRGLQVARAAVARASQLARAANAGTRSAKTSKNLRAKTLMLP